MKKFTRFVMAAVMMALPSTALHAKVGDLINIEYAGNNFVGNAVLGGSFWNMTACANTSLLAVKSDISGFATVNYLNDSGSIIGPGQVPATSSSMASTSYANLYDGYMTASQPGRSITFSGIDANSTYQLVVYSQQEFGVPNKTFEINGSTVMTNNNSMAALTSGVNYATINDLYSNGAGVLSFSYFGSLNGLQLKEIAGPGSAPTPEPASLVLLGVGGLLGARRLKKKSGETSVPAV